MNGTGRCTTVAILAFSAVLALSGCAADENGREVPSGQQSVSDVLQEQSQLPDEQPPAQSAEQEAEQPPVERAEQEADQTATGDIFVSDAPSYDSVDYDLTTMSASVVYATVFDMMTNPDAYVGKTIRMQGPYYHTYYDPTQTDYFYVVIKDATACCSQGLEFVWGDGSRIYPDEYPQAGLDVVVTGVFQTYMEEDRQYVHVVDATLENV